MTGPAARRLARRVLAVLLAASSAALPTIGASAVGASSPPPTPVPATTPPFRYADGVMTAADGTFRASFAAPPEYLVESATSDRFVAAAGEDSQTVVRYPLDGLGAAVDGSPVGRAELFAAASGTDPAWFANTPTVLGPYPASYFIVALTLDGGARAVVYGVVVVGDAGVTYAFATDIGGDDAEAARAFVESFTLLLPPAIASTGPTVAPDGSWAVTFPPGSTPSVIAAADDGFAYTEYRAVGADDVATLRVTAVPEGFVWRPDVVPGHGTVDPTALTVGGRPAAGSTFQLEGAGDVTVRALVVDAGGSILTLTFADGGAASPDAAADFLASLTIPAPAPTTSTAPAPSPATAPPTTT